MYTMLSISLMFALLVYSSFAAIVRPEILKQALSLSEIQSDCMAQMRTTTRICYQKCQNVRSLSEALTTQMEGKDVNKISPIAAAMFDERIAFLFPNESVIDCVDDDALEAIFSQLARHFPLEGLLPQPMNDTLSLPVPTPMATNRSRAPVDAVVNGVDFSECPQTPSYFPETVAFPPCAAATCYITGGYGPTERLEVFQNCVDKYSLGILAHVYSWYFPIESCLGVSCP
uniref:Uncharacterized protein n=1 Tax=Compsopogon caeruleus TaxID=31354 RepID=A0A7S1TCN2_9RHOD|mmetsp:Transcript_17857/g.37091  ORF Transcript_17857/g.37091 Transcript_17857/m.37091 type:complete len:230 (+) Transcript_17857:71-760(+)